MTTGTFLATATKQLSAAGIESARLDCLLLLEDELHLERAHILAHPEAKITSKTAVNLNKKIIQRSQHIPLAYIRGFAPFYGRSFAVNKHVLVPRPESETMITLLKTLPLPQKPFVADIGTGSGCLGITAGLELPDAKIHLHDLDPEALKVARKNSLIHGVKAKLYKDDLLAAYAAQYDVLLANLPYVPKNFAVNAAAKHEPSLALYGGQDGLDVYRRFWQQVGSLEKKPAFILTESLNMQHSALINLAGAADYRQVATDGLVQVFSPTR